MLIFVDELQATLYSDTKQEYRSAYYKMSALDYAASKWVAKSIYNLLNEWFDGKVQFEVDSYYTIKTIKEDSFPVKGNNQLYSTQIEEVFDLMYDYHNILTTVGYGEYESELTYWAGTSTIKNACVKFGNYWDAATGGFLLNDYLSDLEELQDLNRSFLLEVYMHELAHTAEGYFSYDYDLHTALGYSGELQSHMSDVIKPYLLGKFEMNGEMCGVPMEYWKHLNGMWVNYVAQNPDGTVGGRINVIGEIDDNRPVWEQSYIVRNDIKYGTDIVIEAVPLNGYRFVKWSDGITTAIRHDVNIIAYIRVEAIFEKI